MSKIDLHFGDTTVPPVAKALLFGIASGLFRWVVFGSVAWWWYTRPIGTAAYGVVLIGIMYWLSILTIGADAAVVPTLCVYWYLTYWSLTEYLIAAVYMLLETEN